MILFSSAIAYEYDAHECCLPCNVFVPEICPGIELRAQVCFLQPSASNLGWGVVTDFLPFVTPNWHIKTIKPDYHAAFDVGALYAMPCSGMDLQLNWTHFYSRDTKSVSVTPILQWVSPFSQTGPGTGDTNYDPTGVGALTEAHATLKFHYDVVNLDLGKMVSIGCNTQLRLFSGLSGVRIREKLLSNFRNPSNLPRISLNNTSTYTGIGPRLGFNCAYEICGGFNFIGELAGALLFGRLQPAQYKFSGSSEALALIGITSNDESVSSERVSETVPSLDVKLGLNYTDTLCGCSFTLEAGYRGAIYINALSGYESATNVLPLELGSLSTNSMKHIRSDFSVNGPYLELDIKF